MNSNTPTLKHIIIEIAKLKDRITKAAREKQSYTQGNPIKVSADFSEELFRP